MTSRIRKVTYSTIAGVGLFAGAAGLSAAATGNGSDPAPPRTVTPPADIDADDTGVNCENGIDTAGKECDGPAAAEADEADDGVDHQFEGEEVGENGIPDAADANETEDETGEAEEADSDEVDDGVDHQFEGEEVGENGIPDAADANETEDGD